MNFIESQLANIWQILEPLQEDLEYFWIFAIFAIILSIGERLFPVEKFDKSSATGSDIIYSIIENIGLSGLVISWLNSPIMDRLDELVTAVGIPKLHINETLTSIGTPVAVSFLVQLFIFDGFDTLRHRIEHRFKVLWAFHSVHHSQTNMKFWTFDRNHVVSLFFNSIWYASLGRFLGVSLGQLFILVIAMNFVEYLTHANIKLSYGKFLDRVLVCPLYHRVHHAASIDPKYGHYGCNYANLFPFWDLILGSAKFEYKNLKTGVMGQTPEEAGSNWLAHQISGFKLFFQAFHIRSKRPIKVPSQSI